MENQEDIESFKNIHHHLGLSEEWRIAKPDATVAKLTNNTRYAQMSDDLFQRRHNKTQLDV